MVNLHRHAPIIMLLMFTVPNGTEMHHYQPSCLLCVVGDKWFPDYGFLAEIIGEQIPIVQEAYDSHPYSGYIVRILEVRGPTAWRPNWRRTRNFPQHLRMVHARKAIRCGTREGTVLG